MPSHVVDKVLAQPRHQAQGFHVCPERVVVQPEAALVISEEVLLGDAYRIGIGGVGVTGEKEEVLGDDM